MVRRTRDKDMNKVKAVLYNTDWPLLAKQKVALIYELSFAIEVL